MADLKEARDEYVATIQRDINCLSDPDRSTRKRAADKLHKKLIKGDSSGPAPSPELLQMVLCSAVLGPLVRLLADPVEKCRELAISLLSDASEVLPDVAALLSQVVPMVTTRVGGASVAEPSEEIRLQLVQLVGGPLLKGAGGPAMASYMDDLSAVFQRALQDAFHEVKKAACQALERMAALIPAAALEPHTSILVACLLANLSHQHSRVRAACLAALKPLLLVGVPDKFMSESVAPGIRCLSEDTSAPIRKSLAAAVAEWLGAGGSAARFDAWSVDLVPLLLLGVTDASEDVQAHTLALVERVGEAWEAAGEETRGRAAEEVVAGGVSGMSIDEGEGEGGGGGAGVAGDQGALDAGVDPAVLEAAAAVLPPPYKGWPTTGCRRMVRALLPALMPPLLRGAKEWTVAGRSAAARQLHTLVVLAGHRASAHLAELLPVLVSAVGDDDTDTARRVVSVVHMLGACVPVDDWLELALDKASGRGATPPQQASALVVLSGLLHAGGAGEKRPLTPAQTELLARCLAEEDVRGSEHPAVRQQLLAVLTNLVRTGGAACSGCALDVLHPLLQLAAVEDDPALRAGATGVVAELAASAGHGSVEALVEVHAGALLGRLESPPGAEEGGGGGPASWGSGSPDRFVFGALCRAMPGSSLSAHMGRLLDILSGCMDVERDPRLRIDLLRMLDELFEDKGRSGALADVALEILNRVLSPALVWRAGKTAAATRYQGIVALGSMLREGHVTSDALVASLKGGELLPSIHACLDDDFYADCRRVTCHVMYHLCATAGDLLTPDQRRAIYPELLKRMDDSNDDVRIAAAGACRAFFQPPYTYDDTNTGYFIGPLLVHMDDADPQVQEAVCAAVEAAAAVKPRCVEEAVNAARERHRSSIYCDRCLAAARRKTPA